MQELELTLRRIVSIWWFNFWRTVLGAVLLGALAAVVSKVTIVLIALVIAGGATPNYPSEETTRMIGTVLGGLLGFWWAFTVFKMTFRKKFGDFRLAVIALEPNRASGPAN
jgi:hypothetical protein